RNGQIVDGDKIMFICAKYLREQGLLNSNTIVSTVMSNLGFYKGLKELNIEDVQTAVGDRYVVEAMREGNYNLGGEQSGHIIFLDHNTTGDGLLSGIQLINVMKATGKKLSELASEMKTFPQKLENIRVSDKNHVTDNPKVSKVISEVETEMAGNGRVLVRPSGTEPLVRVMVEAATKEKTDEYCERISAVVRAEMALND
ncbi:phosphoglucosamine mutase, partial [Listeria ivanovii FSL F6-596]